MVCTLGIFAVLIGLLPNDMLTYQDDYYTAPTTRSQEVVDYYTAHNITLYTNTWAFNITTGEMEFLADFPQTDHQLECHWGTDWTPDFMEFRHAYPYWYFPWALDHHPLIPREPYLTLMCEYSETPKIGIFNLGNILEIASNDSAFFDMSCEHIMLNAVIVPSNETATLTEAWNTYEDLTIMTSYEIDFEGMKPNAWLLITQLVTFQEPELGIPGAFGQVLTYIFGIGFWVVVAILVYTILTKIIPTISGGIEG